MSGAVTQVERERERNLMLKSSMYIHILRHICSVTERERNSKFEIDTTTVNRLRRREWIPTDGFHRTSLLESEIRIRHINIYIYACVPKLRHDCVLFLFFF